MRQLLKALDDYSYGGLIDERTFLKRIIYIARWIMTSFVCWLFYMVILLSTFATMFLLFNIIISICERL